MSEMTPREAADEFEYQRPQSANSEWGRVLVRCARDADASSAESVDLERAAIALFDQEAVRRYGSGASGLWERLTESERDVLRESARYVLSHAGVDLPSAPDSSEPK